MSEEDHKSVTWISTGNSINIFKMGPESFERILTNSFLYTKKKIVKKNKPGKQMRQCQKQNP